jgi:hypothetical protein
MDALHYVDFDIRIEQSGDAYVAHAVSPEGEGRSSFTLPFTDDRLELLILKLGHTRSRTRRVNSPELSIARELGAALFQSVFTGDVRDRYRDSLNEAVRHGTGLRIKLRLQDVPRLGDLPWELLYDPSGDFFLAQSNQTPVVRYLELPQPVRPLHTVRPLRLLVLVSSPLDHLRLDVEHEQKLLSDALAPLVEKGRVEIDWVHNATMTELQRRLRRGTYHVFHFVGHGGFDAATQEGVLVLEDEREYGAQVAAHRVASLLRDHRSLRLAVLNSCEGARNSREDSFAGVATTMVRQGIPAVIAMQFEITDGAAVAFAGEFYTALADGLPVDAALAEARKAIFAEPNDTEWATPVLYMRAPNGVIFELEEAAQPAHSGAMPAAAIAIETPVVHADAISDSANAVEAAELIEAPPVVGAAAPVAATPVISAADVAAAAPEVAAGEAAETLPAVSAAEVAVSAAAAPDESPAEAPPGPFFASDEPAAEPLPAAAVPEEESTGDAVVSVHTPAQSHYAFAPLAGPAPEPKQSVWLQLRRYRGAAAIAAGSGAVVLAGAIAVQQRPGVTADPVDVDSATNRVEDPIQQEPQIVPPTVFSLGAPPFPVGPATRADRAPLPDFELRLVSDRANEITDEDSWFSTHGLPRQERGRNFTAPAFAEPRYAGRFPVRMFRHGDRVLIVYGQDYAQGDVLLAYGTNGRFEWGLDFSAYSHPPGVSNEHAFQQINWAYQVDHVLYVSHTGGGYASESKGMNAYVTALDIGTQPPRVLWRSRPLVSNAASAVVIGSYLVTGYGFTAEPDYLIVLSRATGDIAARVPLRSAPDHIIRKGDELYVRTYDRDYVFAIGPRTSKM